MTTTRKPVRFGTWTAHDVEVRHGCCCYRLYPSVVCVMKTLNSERYTVGTHPHSKVVRFKADQIPALLLN